MKIFALPAALLPLILSLPAQEQPRTGAEKPAVPSNSGASEAGKWARFHGNGGAAGPVEAPAAVTERDIAWKVKLPGSGCSSPVLWANRIFLTAAEGSKRYVVCYNSSSGEEMWRHEDTFSPHAQHKFNSFASSTLAADSGQVYLAWTSGGSMRAMALTLEGKPVWSTDLGPYKEDHGSGASPVVVGGIVVVCKDSEGEPGDSFIAGLNTKDGSIAWKLPRRCDRTPFSTPLVHEEKPGEPKLIVSSNPQALTCIDPVTGKAEWEVDKLVPGLRAVGSPAWSDGIFYATTGQGGVGKSSVAVRLKDGKPEIVWEAKKGMPYVPTPVGAGKHFYCLNDGGLLVCITAADGKEVWNERIFNGSQAYASPVLAGDRIFCISRNGKLAAARTGDKFVKLFEMDLGEPCDATPAIADGKLFIRTETQLLCIGAADARP